MTGDFETHPCGTGARLAQLEAEVAELRAAAAAETVLGTLKGPDLKLGESVIPGFSGELVLRNFMGGAVAATGVPHG